MAKAKGILWGAFSKRSEARQMAKQLRPRGVKARVVTTKFYRLKLTPVRRRRR